MSKARIYLGDTLKALVFKVGLIPTLCKCVNALKINYLTKFQSPASHLRAVGITKMSLLSSIQTLSLLSLQINRTYAVLELLSNHKSYFQSVQVDFHEHKTNFHELSLQIVIEQFILHLTSFMDEWNSELNPNKLTKFSEEVLELKLTTKPISQRINKWSDLKNFRNILVAHNYKHKGESIFDSDTPFRFNIPNTLNEFKLITKLLDLKLALTAGKFKNEFDASRDFKFSEFITVKHDSIDIEYEFDLIKKQVFDKMAEQRVQQ